MSRRSSRRDLARGLNSLIAQTYQRWIAIVLTTARRTTRATSCACIRIAIRGIFLLPVSRESWRRRDDEIGMALACEMTEWWTRLGSDDFFGPRKLELDAKALRVHERGVRHVSSVSRWQDGRSLQPARPAEMIRRALLTSGFAARGRIARRAHERAAQVARSVRQLLRSSAANMEDFSLNARIARESTGWVFVVRSTGISAHPSLKTCSGIQDCIRAGEKWDFEAAWNCVATGASGNTMQEHARRNLTRQLIVKENIKRGRA